MGRYRETDNFSLSILENETYLILQIATFHYDY